MTATTGCVEFSLPASSSLSTYMDSSTSANFGGSTAADRRWEPPPAGGTLVVNGPKGRGPDPAAVRDRLGGVYVLLHPLPSRFERPYRRQCLKPSAILVQTKSSRWIYSQTHHPRARTRLKTKFLAPVDTELRLLALTVSLGSRLRL